MVCYRFMIHGPHRASTLRRAPPVFRDIPTISMAILLPAHQEAAFDDRKPMARISPIEVIDLMAYTSNHQEVTR